jgi:hypothetical protein
MHRSTLTLRRFGPMSFGLGYYENGIWIDHSGSVEGNASQPGDMALAAVHRWYGCCADPIATQSSVMADEPDLRPSTIARSERPSASVLALMRHAPVRAVEK